MNEIAALQGVKIEVREKYAIEYLEQILKRFVSLCGIEPEKIVRGRGHHKSTEQRLYDKLSEYIKVKKCGTHRNMRRGEEQLLQNQPRRNVYAHEA